MAFNLRNRHFLKELDFTPAELEYLLAQLPPSVTHVVWDTTLPSQAVRMTAVSDLRRVILG